METCVQHVCKPLAGTRIGYSEKLNAMQPQQGPRQSLYESRSQMVLQTVLPWGKASFRASTLHSGYPGEGDSFG